MPGDRSFTEGVSILGRHELPKGKEVVFSITPRDCYRVCGDVKFDEVSKKCEAITPVPGGVGAMTMACLLQNTMKAYKSRQ